MFLNISWTLSCRLLSLNVPTLSFYAILSLPQLLVLSRLQREASAYLRQSILWMRRNINKISNIKCMNEPRNFLTEVFSFIGCLGSIYYSSPSFLRRSMKYSLALETRLLASASRNKARRVSDSLGRCSSTSECTNGMMSSLP